MTTRIRPRLGLWAGVLLAATAAGFGSAAMASAPPTFDQVMAAPDDPKLNLDYAVAEEEAGHLLSAAAAYERVLLQRPQWYSVRFRYAIVLYRLDDPRGAEQQLKLLDGAPLTPSENTLLSRYHHLSSLGPGAASVTSGQFVLGANYDSDAYGAVYTQFNTPGSAALRQGGASGIVSGRIDESIRLGTDSRLSAYGSILGYDKFRLTGPHSDLQVGEVRGGLSDTTSAGAWRAGAVARRYQLFGSPYLTEYGGQADGSVRVGGATDLTGSVEGVWQDFREPLVDAQKAVLGGTHDGARYDVSVGVAQRPAPGTNLSASVGYEVKSAGYRPFAYRAPHVDANVNVQFDRGVYVNLLGGLKWASYDAPDAVYLGNAKRSDTLSNMRAELGVPLSAFNITGQDLTLLAAVTYGSRDSTAPLAGYSNVGGQLLVIWRLGGRD